MNTPVAHEKDTVTYLFDGGSVLQIADWLLNNAVLPLALGVGASLIPQRLQAFQQRHGQRKLVELRTRVRELALAARHEARMDEAAIDERIESLFKGLD